VIEVGEKSLLSQIEFHQEAGSLLFNDVRYMLIRPETLAALQKLIEKELGPRSVDLICESGFTGGRLSTEKYRERFHLSSEEVLHYMLEMGTQIGWGKFVLERFEPEVKRISVRVSHSPFAAAYGLSSKPVCHFIRGVLGGISTGIFGDERKVEEIHCAAQGRPFCLFDTKS